MINIEKYIQQLIDLLKIQFDRRLLYVGLQGSYLRGEATSHSDIDIMVVIDNLAMSDLDTYRCIIESLENSDKSCGFICSKADLKNWNPLEICHLLNSTKDCFGTLHTLVPAYTQQDIKNFVKLSLNNLYHEICHRYIHSDATNNAAKLPGTYKCVFFILQNLHYLSRGKFINNKSDLLHVLEGKNHAVLSRAIDIDQGKTFDFAECFELLFTWCQEALQLIDTL